MATKYNNDYEESESSGGSDSDDDGPKNEYITAKKIKLPSHRGLKFSSCLPDRLGEAILQERLSEPAGIEYLRNTPVRNLAGN